MDIPERGLGPRGRTGLRPVTSLVRNSGTGRGSRTITHSPLRFLIVISAGAAIVGCGEYVECGVVGSSFRVVCRSAIGERQRVETLAEGERGFFKGRTGEALNSASFLPCVLSSRGKRVLVIAGTAALLPEAITHVVT
jgi:hypothetical protein